MSERESSGTVKVASSPIFPMPRVSRRWIEGFTLAALVMSAVLMWHDGQEHSVLPGCSGDDACNLVTGGRWALLAGIPVAALGLTGYAGLMVMSLLTRIRMPDRGRVGLWSAMATSSLIGLGFIAWLIFLQWAVIKHFCIYCLTTHLFGATAFVSILYFVPVWHAFPKARMRIGGVSATALSVMIALHVLVVPDLTVAQEATSFDRAAAETGGSGGIQFGKKRSSRTIDFMDGNLSLDIYTLPIIGSRDAEHVVIELFDYTCPSCRKVSAKLEAFAALYAGQLAVVTIPVPMDTECNPNVKRTISQFQNACAYARIGMAVYQADPNHFPAFHHWMMEGGKIPSVGAAREKAVALIGEAALAGALKEPAIEQWIGDGINIYGFIQGKRFPRSLPATRSYPPADWPAASYMRPFATRLICPKSLPPRRIRIIGNRVTMR